jgi:hypothetical protein
MKMVVNIIKELKAGPLSNKALKYKNYWIQYVNIMQETDSLNPYKVTHHRG